MFKAALLIVLIFASLSLYARPVSMEDRDSIMEGWQSCGGYATIYSLNVSPYSPPYPISIQLNANTNNTKGLQDGKVSFKYGLTEVQNGKRYVRIRKTGPVKPYAFCSLQGTYCPYDPGFMLANIQIPSPTIQKSPPQKQYFMNATISIYDQDDKLFLCLSSTSYPV
ncbi:hypothetical protein HDU79_008720 [Rhizoclosmatium sp. JEL0117]|nr:hypothetical protein HDU79_008720 [Rhizoclosmatium sp. JEL0117]